MFTSKDQKLIDISQKKRAQMEERKQRVRNGGGSAYDKLLVRQEQQELTRQLKMEEEKENSDAKRSRDDAEFFLSLSKARRLMDENCETEYGGGDDDDDAMWIDVDQPVPAHRVERVHNRTFNPKKPRKQFWVDYSDELINAFIKSFEKCGEPDFKLEKPLEASKPIGCDCVIRNTVKLTGYMFGGI